jgi:hypothetical protein
MSDVFRQVRVTFDIPGRGGPGFAVTFQLPLGSKEAGVQVTAVQAPCDEIEAGKIASDWLRDRFRSWSVRS